MILTLKLHAFVTAAGNIRFAVGSSGSLTIDGTGPCVIDGGRSTWNDRGGGIINSGSLTVQVPITIQSFIAFTGGAIETGTNSTTTFNSAVTISENTATYGGGLRNNGATTFSDYILFDQNVATGNGGAGGALMQNGGTIAFNAAVVFSGNTATNAAGHGADSYCAATTGISWPSGAAGHCFGSNHFYTDMTEAFYSCDLSTITPKAGTCAGPTPPPTPATTTGAPTTAAGTSRDLHDFLLNAICTTVRRYVAQYDPCLDAHSVLVLC